MIRKSLFALAASVMTFTAFGGTYAVMQIDTVPSSASVA